MNNYFMLAIKEAKKAYKSNNTPIGAVIVKNDKIISKAHNKKNSMNIPLYHAEILAIIRACKRLKTWRLNDCQLYVTLEPCKMCLSIIAESRIKKVYFLLNSKYNFVENSNMSKIDLKQVEDNYNYNKLLSDFFKQKR